MFQKREESTLNILMLTPEFLPIRGGVGTYVFEVARNLPRECDIHIVTPTTHGQGMESGQTVNGNLPENLTIHEIPTSGGRYLKSLSFQLKCRRMVPRIMREERIDIIHSQSEMPDRLISPARLSVPIVTTVHSTIERHYNILKESVKNHQRLSRSERLILTSWPALKSMENRYYSDDRSYISVSEWGKGQLMREKGVDPDNIHVVHNGVDSQRFNPSNREGPCPRLNHLSDHGKTRIIYLSRLETRKGINLLIRAIPKVVDRADVSFLIAGPGTVPGIGGTIPNSTIMGPIPHDETPALYAHSDIFILPSLSENLPISVLEAMASQTAVVATDICGIPEIIRNEENGLLIPPNDVDAIANSLVRLTESEDLRDALAREGRSTVRDRFSWMSTASKTYECYRTVLDRRSSR